jgi:voltage-gated potassium channel
MLGGIALIGVVTATLASYIVDRVSEHEDGSVAATRQEVHELAEEIRQLRREIGQRAGHPAGAVGGPEAGLDPSAPSSR